MDSGNDDSLQSFMNFFSGLPQDQELVAPAPVPSTATKAFSTPAPVVNMPVPRLFVLTTPIFAHLNRGLNVGPVETEASPRAEARLRNHLSLAAVQPGRNSIAKKPRILHPKKTIEDACRDNVIILDDDDEGDIAIDPQASESKFGENNSLAWMVGDFCGENAFLKTEFEKFKAYVSPPEKEIGGRRGPEVELLRKVKTQEKEITTITNRLENIRTKRQE
jgi:hypothetical protein